MVELAISNTLEGKPIAKEILDNFKIKREQLQEQEKTLKRKKEIEQLYCEQYGDEAMYDDEDEPIETEDPNRVA